MNHLDLWGKQASYKEENPSLRLLVENGLNWGYMCVYRCVCGGGNHAELCGCGQEANMLLNLQQCVLSWYFVRDGEEAHDLRAFYRLVFYPEPRRSIRGTIGRCREAE